MIIEHKEISALESALFLKKSLNLIGSYFYAPNTKADLSIIENIANIDPDATLLLTPDFLYIKATTPQKLTDLIALSSAELDDLINEETSLIGNNQNIEQKIRIILKTVVAPFLQKDGGNIEFISYENNIVKVRFLGKCHGCPYAKTTLKERVEKNLVKYLPIIEKVIMV